jgi:[acyl-carrier-protein] S-malonyltransferase
MPPPHPLGHHPGATAFAFRGYNVTNLGRTPELLDHPAYGRVVQAALREGGQICAETVGRPVDLVARIRDRRETTGLAEFAEDVALIVAVELAQVRLLAEFFGVAFAEARLAFGYSLGEAAALIAAGVYEMRDLLPAPLAAAADCVALADGVTLGVLFSRGPRLDLSAVRRLCLQVTQAGHGTVAVSAYLSPNSVLLLGQAGTLDRFAAAMPDALPGDPQAGAPTYLRRNAGRWPPLHTPITWQRAIPNRTAVRLQTTAGGFRAPAPPVLSGVTGEASYDADNSRDLIHRWIDHPQQFWRVVCGTLAAGVEAVVHVGPQPNLVPATFKRLGDNVRSQIAGYAPGRLGLRAAAHVARRTWLTRLLPSGAALLRAPFVRHIILEDWLLDRPVP